MAYLEADLLRLRTISTESPRKIPAAIDSHGKPGIAGTTSGVVTLVVELDEDGAVTVVLTELTTLEELLTTWLVDV